MDSNKKKALQLGMPTGTASNRLKKSLLLKLLKESNKNICYRCNKDILDEAELSIDHKEPWFNSENPVEKFFDLDNIAFSHLTCNISVASKPHKKYFTEEAFKEVKNERGRVWRAKNYTPEKRRDKYLRLGT